MTDIQAINQHLGSFLIGIPTLHALMLEKSEVLVVGQNGFVILSASKKLLNDEKYMMSIGRRQNRLLQNLQTCLIHLISSCTSRIA